MFFKVNKHFYCIIFSAVNATSCFFLKKKMAGRVFSENHRKLCLNPKPKFTERSVKLNNLNSNF